MARAILRQGGDLGPGAGGGHQAKAGRPEGAAEVARDGELDGAVQRRGDRRSQ